MKRIVIILLPAVAGLLSCTHEEIARPGGDIGATKEVRITVLGSERATRSSLPHPEDGMGKVDILVYESGLLVESVNGDAGWGDSYSASLGLVVGQTYDILVMANYNGREVPGTLTDAERNLVYTADPVNAWTGSGLPMGGRTSLTVSYGTDEVEIELKRLVAKLKLKVDTRGLSHGSVEIASVKVCQMNKYCPFFADGIAASASGVCDGDIAGAGDLGKLNRYQEAEFYLTENKQGDILEGNSDPDAKTPDEVLAAGGDPDLCTYLEVRGLYMDSSTYLTGDPIIARVFLGGDACVNFDIVRNNTYTLTLVFTDSGCLRCDWKLESNLDDRRELEFEEDESVMGPGEYLPLTLFTNLNYEDYEYYYKLTGDVTCFNTYGEFFEDDFTVYSKPSAPSGAHLDIEAYTWDRSLVARHRVSVVRHDSDYYEFTLGRGGVLYLAQEGTLIVKDKRTGSYPSGTVSVVSTNYRIDLWRSGGTWYLDAVSPGDDVLQVKVNGNVVGTVAVTVVSPYLRFADQEILLPVDGADIDCGPYYYRTDGSRLYYDDFEPDLYEELLDYYIVRSASGDMLGRYWRRAAGGGNPAVDMSGGIDDGYSFRLGRLSSGGRSISDNYDFSDGDVTLEEVEAIPYNDDAGIPPASAVLYTGEPFRSSQNLGTRVSWALARWYEETEHDEKFVFEINNIVLPGNDHSLAGAVYPFSSERKYDFSFPSTDRLEMTVLYSDYFESAMPERYFYLVPVMTNRNSGEEYRSIYQYEVAFTVNLALGGVAEDNGAGGCDVSVEWSFPRADDNFFWYLENNVTGSRCNGNGYAEGMYRRLYSIYGYSESSVTEYYTPDYSFRTLGASSGYGSLLGGSSYAVPEGYALGYDLVLWKYGSLYPASNGWLRK